MVEVEFKNFRQFFMIGIEASNPTLTKRWRIWFCYLSWSIHSYLYYWKWRRRKHNGWEKQILKFFVKHRGGLTHRSEFTDRKEGALYTGTIDPFMERAFEQFVEIKEGE